MTYSTQFGTYLIQAMISIADTLFTKTQQKIMGLLFTKPDTSYYLNEIVRLAGMGKGTIKRELEKMTESGLLTVTRIGNQNHYQANVASPVFDELKAISRKTFGIKDVIKHVLNPIEDQIDFAFIYGSIAKNTDTANSDIDLMMVGEELAYADIMNLLIPAEKELQHTINPSIYSLTDFKKKLESNNNFLSRVLEQNKIMVIGEEDAIRQTG